jgi:hypothetical protein
MNLTAAMFWFEREFGLVISTNIASTAADDALRKAAAELYRGFLKLAIRKLTDFILVDRMPNFFAPCAAFAPASKAESRPSHRSAFAALIPPWRLTSQHPRWFCGVEREPAPDRF